MELISVFDERFRAYGKVIRDYDCSALLKAMEATSCPSDSVLYIPSVPELECLPIFTELRARQYGEMPIQMGFTNGYNRRLDALEYHRSSEWNLACTDLILLLGREQDVEHETFRYDTSKVEAFLVPAGVAFETYATTLHYAPCSYNAQPYRMVVVLPKGTNLPLDARPAPIGEDKLIAAKNKWLIAHPECGYDPAVTHFGLYGENLTV